MFLLSIPASLKAHLLKAAALLVYTPDREHFGIVPLEAMLAGIPVLAVNSGGPLETVQEGVTGWLRAQEDGEWSDVMRKAVFEMGVGERKEMGQKGRERVLREFSKGKMAERLEREWEGVEVGGGKEWAWIALGVAGAVVGFTVVLAW